MWGAYRQEIVHALIAFEQEVLTPGAETRRVETHYGWGEYNGVGEMGAHVSLLIECQPRGAAFAYSMAMLRHQLARIGFSYGQECLALITGSKLIKARGIDCQDCGSPATIGKLGFALCQDCGKNRGIS